MKLKTRYLLLTTGIVGFSLAIFNSIKMQHWVDTKLELDISKILFVLGLINFGLYFLIKNKKSFFTKIMIGTFGTCFFLNVHLTFQYYKFVQRQNRLSEYHKLDTCEEMKNRFAIDLKNGKIKYFHFGLGYDTELEELLEDKYEIESFGLGCLIDSKMICYNKLVDEYLKEKFNDRIANY